MRSSSWIAVAAAALVSLSAPSVRAGALTVVPDNDALRVRDGEQTVATFSPKTPQAQRGPAGVRALTVAGRQVIEVSIPVQGEVAGRNEVWLAERGSGTPKVIWWNVTGPQDADSETALVLEATSEAIVEYQTARRLSRCDGAAVPLFRRVWSFASRSFGPTPPALAPASAPPLRAQRGGAPAGKPLGGFFFNAASSSQGATDASRLRPPAAVNDDNPATAWSTHAAGTGHLLTARSSGGFPIIGLRLWPGDTATERNYRASAKPRRVTLIFGADRTQNVEAELVEDADGGVKRMSEPFWIPLSKPVAAACVTVVIRSTTSDKVPTAIAGMDVMTELDGPQAADRLVESLAEGGPCPARLPLLVRLGSPAIGKTAAAIIRATPGPGRECLVAALAALLGTGSAAPPEAGDALIAAIAKASPDEEKAILARLPNLPEPPVAGVAAVLDDDKRSDDDRARAARVLAAIDRPAAKARLVAAIGQGSSGLRKEVRLLAAGPRGAALPAVLDELRKPAAQDTGRRADLLAVTGALAARATAGRGEALALLRAPLEQGASFEEQGRAIGALGLLHEPAAIAALIAVRAGSKDAVLRALATNELAAAPGAAVIPALRAALADADPQVRETAATALGSKRDQEAAQLIITGAEQEPWPQVRRAEIAALGELCTTEGNQLLLRAFQKDVEEVRQVALAGIARCYQAKATGTLLRTLGRLPESADMRSLAARLLGERKDPRTVTGLTQALGRLLTESQADLSLEGVIADTAMTLAAIRSPAAISALASLISDPRPSVQRMGVDALAIVCDPGNGAAALRLAAQSKDESVASRAAAAEGRCRDRH